MTALNDAVRGGPVGGKLEVGGGQAHIVDSGDGSPETAPGRRLQATALGPRATRDTQVLPASDYPALSRVAGFFTPNAALAA